MGEEEMTAEAVKKQMSADEWQKVYDMSQDKNLYSNLCSSLFPTIHGQCSTVDKIVNLCPDLFNTINKQDFNLQTII